MSILTADTVSFIWNAGGSSLNANGAGATQAAWDAGSPSDFIGSDGEAISAADTHNGSQTACTVTTSGGGHPLITKANGFTNVVSGTIAFVVFDAIYDTGYYIATAVNANSIELGDIAYSADTTCDIYVGGAALNLSAVTGDIGDASTQNRRFFIRGDEQLSGDQSISNGGSASTLLSIYGVDASWARITPTRTTPTGGSNADGPLDTSVLSKISWSGGTNQIDVAADYIYFDGLWITGSHTAHLFGSSSSDFITITNSVIANAGNGAGSFAVRLDNDNAMFNCDFICTGATAAMGAVFCDSINYIGHCRISVASSSATSRGINIQAGCVLNCLFFDLSGIGVLWSTAAPNGFSVHECTFENVLTCIQSPNADIADILRITGNIAQNCTNFYENLGATDQSLLATYNNLNTITTMYPADAIGDFSGSPKVGFQDVTGDPLFVSLANEDYDLQATSPSKNTSPFKGDRGAMASAESGGGATQLVNGGLIS
jgi:hypothetical protein